MPSYPLVLSFKLLSIGPQVRVTDAAGSLVAYVKQKAFKLKEDITIFADEGQSLPLYRVKADRILDFNATYSITDLRSGRQLGALQREGGRSIWRATYRILNANGVQVGEIHEQNPWIKLLDGLLEEVPVIGMFTGYFLNPSYLLEVSGSPVLRIRKRPAFFEGKFLVEPVNGMLPEHEELLLPSLVTMVLLERSRG